MCEPLDYITFSLESGKKAVKEIGSVISRPRPDKPGFVSDRYCLYPFDLLLQLNRVSVVSKIQIMINKDFVPKTIKIYFGEVPPGKAISQRNAIFADEPAGVIDLEEPDTTLAAREMKNLEVNGDQWPVAFVKLRLSANHPSKYNKYNQVGIVGVAIFGKVLNDGEESYGNLGHDLVTLAYIDPEIVDVIQRLEEKKVKAAKLDKPKELERLKDAIRDIYHMGLEHGKMIAEAKAMKKRGEDSEAIREITTEAEHLKLTTYNDLACHDLLANSFLP